MINYAYELDRRGSCSHLLVLLLQVTIQRNLPSNHIIQSRHMWLHYLSVLIHQVDLEVVWNLLHYILLLLYGCEVVVPEVVLLLLQTVVDFLV